MGFNKRYLPIKEELEHMVFDFGVEHVINNYKSADMLMGSAESLAYFKSLCDSYGE